MTVKLTPQKPPAPPPLVWRELVPGDVLGSYRIVKALDSGGMALIYQAQHIKIGRVAVLKILRPELSLKSDEVERFFEEARAVNEIKHPHIIDIYDFIEERGCTPPLVYMVMELLVGVNLHQHIHHHGALPFSESLTIAEQTADALAAMHKINILQRDLKPSNIFITRDDANQIQIKLLDFGLAKAFGDRQGAGITKPEIIVGTPEYMAPEQILGTTMDQRADIYSLGLVLYEMVTAQRAFAGKQETEILVRQAKEDAKMPSEFRPDLPSDIEELIIACLAKNPAHRWQTMEEFIAALRVCRANLAPEVVSGQSKPSLLPAPSGSFSGPMSQRQLSKNNLVSTSWTVELRKRRMFIGTASLFFILALITGLYFLFKTPDAKAPTVSGASAAPAPDTGSAAGSKAAEKIVEEKPAVGNLAPDKPEPAAKPSPAANGSAANGSAANGLSGGKKMKGGKVAGRKAKTKKHTLTIDPWSH